MSPMMSGHLMRLFTAALLSAALWTAGASGQACYTVVLDGTTVVETNATVAMYIPGDSVPGLLATGSSFAAMPAMRQDALVSAAAAASRPLNEPMPSSQQAIETPLQGGLARETVELTREACSALTEERVRSIIGAPRIITLTLSCPNLVITCAGAPLRAERLCRELRKELLHVNSPMRQALLSAAE